MKYFKADRFFYNSLHPEYPRYDQVIIESKTKKQTEELVLKDNPSRYAFYEISKETFKFCRDESELQVLVPEKE